VPQYHIAGDVKARTKLIYLALCCKRNKREVECLYVSQHSSERQRGSKFVLNNTHSLLWSSYSYFDVKVYTKCPRPS